MVDGHGDDGTAMETVDTQSNADAFGRPGAGRGKGAYPQLGLVSLVENRTQVLFGGRMADYHTGGITLANG